MNDFETLIFEKTGRIAGVTLNRPEVLNIHNMAMRDDLFEVLSAIREDDEIRVVLFKGAGEKAFCAGCGPEGIFDRASPDRGPGGTL